MRKSARIAFFYAMASGLWVLFSDKAADALFSSSPGLLAAVHTGKGWFFVVVTALILCLALRRVERQDSARIVALEESEARYRSVLENISDVYYRTGPDGALSLVSPSGVRLLGYASQDELLGRPNESFWLHPEERAVFLQELARTGNVHDYEVVLQRKDGSGIVVSTSSRLMLSADGAMAGVEGIFRDITSRKQAEEALRKNEQRLVAIFDTSPSSIFLVDTAGRILMANKRMAEMFGYPPEDLPGLAYPSLVHPEQRSLGTEMMRALLAGETPQVSLERRYLRADGSEFWGHLSGTRMTGALDGKDALVGIIADISERKAVEAQLAASNALVNSILDAMHSAVIGLDEQGLVTHFNRRAQTLSGKSFEQAVGKPIESALPSLPVSGEQLRDALASRATAHFEKVPFTLGPAARLMDIVLYPLASSGSGGMVVVMEDVTERARLEEVMIQTEKMMSVGGLAAGMAHEINNPLGGIIQGTQVMLRRIEADTKANREAASRAGCSLESIRAYMDHRNIVGLMREVRGSAVRAAAIVSSMLEFSRKSETGRSPVDLNALLDKAVDLAASDYDLKKRYDFKKVRIAKEYDPSLPLVACTATQIEQVFLNVLRNAAQAMASSNGDGEPPLLTLRTVVEAGAARVEIEDNGPGMTEDVRRKAFEPFFSTKPPGEGTGLGLSVSYFIVTSNHKGSFEVRSRPGEGSTFVIRLPLGEVPAGRRAA